MAKEKASTLLRTLLELIKTKHATAEVITGAWHLASRAKDIDAMAAIAEADNLPEDVLTAVKARTEIPIAVSYLTRSGLSAEERRNRLQAEERAGVLAGVLLSDKVNDEDRKVLATKIIAKPTRALAEAVITDGSMPLDAVVIAISELDTRVESLTDGQRSNLRRQVKRVATDSEAATKLAGLTSNVSIGHLLLTERPVLDESSFRTLFELTTEKQIAQWVNAHGGKVQTYRIVSLLRQIAGENGDYHPTVILEALNRHFEPEVVAEVWTEIVGATRAMTDTSSNSAYSSKILAASSSEDQTVLEDLLNEAIGGVPALFDPLMRNPNTSHEMIERLAAHVDERTTAKLLETRKGDEQTAMVVYKLVLDRAINLDKWAAFSDRRKAEEELIAHFVERWYEDPSYYGPPMTGLNHLISEVQNRDLLGLMPWSFLSEVIGRYNSTDVAKLISEVQTEYLGTDTQRWETAQVLAQDYSGSLRDLFRSAATL